MSQTVLNKIIEGKIVAIVRGIPSTKILGLATALEKGGVNCIEVTFDQSSEEKARDTLAAIRAGLEQGCGLFSIYGGTGGKRLDHTLANLQSLLFLRRRGARGFLWDDDFVWTVIENEALTVARTVEWGLFSAFCLGDRAEGVDEEGFQYPLKNAALTPDVPLGVSNHILEQSARITVRKGALAVGWELPPLD